MDDLKWFNISNDNLSLSVKSNNRTLDGLELCTEAILTLIHQFDIKCALDNDPENGHERIDASLNRILEEIHLVAKLNGWQ